MPEKKNIKVMQNINNNSLGNQVAKKISVWVFILVVTVIIGLFSVVFLLSKQLFTQQVATWKTAIPQYALTSLMDSDYDSVKKDAELLQSTGLFESFLITDNKKRPIVKFGQDNINPSVLLPIEDQAKVVWGYYSYKANFTRFFAPFLISLLVILGIVLIAYFFIRWRMQLYLRDKFSKFNEFLQQIEKLTGKVSEINENGEIELNLDNEHQNTEQVIINNAILRLLNEIKHANKIMREAISKAEQSKFEQELTKTALQVAHDIGSPLATLEMVVQSPSYSLDEERHTYIRNAVSRIKDISYSLLKKAKHDLTTMQGDAISQYSLASLIAFVINEKQLQFSPNIKITFHLNEKLYGLFATVKASDFCRIISNLTNNAVDAIDKEGLINIELFEESDAINLKIIDNGIGIPKDLLPQLGNLGVTFGKAQGTGVGLHHAKEMITTWGGQIIINSAEQKGTTVHIKLPKAQPPMWYLPQLNLNEEQIVIVIDDDKCIHDVWKHRLEQTGAYDGNIKLLHLYSPEELIKWHEEHQPDGNVIYLCDYEFIGAPMNGIELINHLKINFYSVLVSGQLGLQNIINSCEEYSIKFLPKNLAGVVPIKM